MLGLGLIASWANAQGFHGIAKPSISPSECAAANAPSWCSGSTADAWIRAACNQLPAHGGIVDLTGFGATAQTIAASLAGCSSPTRQITFLFDTATYFLVTESDGGIVFPLDNASAAVGFASGQCQDSTGIHLAATANITALFGPAHTDGSQESMAVKGICAFGATGATVTKGLIYINSLATNTTIEQNNIFICNTACAWVENPAGQIEIAANWFNVTDGDFNVTGSGLVIYAVGGGGVRASNVEVFGNTIEHANGAGQNEVNVTSAGDGSILLGINLHDNYSERGGTGSIPSAVSVHIQDCWNCTVKDYNVWGGNSQGEDAFNVGQSAVGRTQNVTFQNDWTSSGSYANLINDTVHSTVIPAATNPGGVTNYVVNPGFSGTGGSPVINSQPSLSLSASPQSITVGEGGSATILITMSESGGSSSSVSLSAGGLPSGLAASFAAGSAVGTQVLTLTAGSSAAATSGSVPVTITASSATVAASTTIAVSISQVSSFTSGPGTTTGISVAPGATTGNAGTIAVVGTNGFAGTVNLGCKVTTAMNDVSNMPTCALNPLSIAISGSSAGTSKLTVTTTAAVNAKNRMSMLFGAPAVGTALALAVLAAVPRRRRRSPTVLGLVFLLGFFGTIGCSQVSLREGSGGGLISGSTPGAYTIFVTGNSGAISAVVASVPLTVQ